MRKSHVMIALAASLVAAPAVGPAMGQVIIQTPNGDASRHEMRAQQDRADARWERHEAQRRAAMGDYYGAAQADREARRDWHDARRQEYRAQQESGGIIIGR